MTLRRQATSALAWTWTNAVVGAVFQLTITIVVARLLLPADFGLVAVAAVLIRFLAYFSQMGISVAIVQRATIGRHELAGLMSLSTLIGAGFTAVGLAGAMFVRSDVSAVLRVLSFSFLISSFSVVPIGVLRRDLKYRPITIAELLAQLLGNGAVTIVLAYLGAGVWALVMGSLVQQGLVAAITMYAAVRQTGWIGFGRIGTECRAYLAYGLTHSINTFLEFIYFNAEVLVLDHSYGVNAVGYYNRGMSLTHLPVEQAIGSVTRVMFPLLARLRGAPEKERTTFVAAFLFCGIFATGFSAALYMSAPEVTTVLLGARWLPAVPVIQVLAIAVPVRYLFNIQSAALDAVGALKARTTAAVACLLVKTTLAIVALTMHASVQWLLAAIIVPDVLWQLYYLHAMPRHTSVVRKVLVQAYGVFAGTAALCVAAIAGLTAFAHAMGARTSVTFAAELVTGGLVVVVASLIVTRFGLLGLRADTLRALPLFGRLAALAVKGRRA